MQSPISTGPTFEEYLASKKIDSQRFKSAEPDLWNAWRSEFEEMHPSSFTVQKLNLINPIRRKYQLMIATDDKHVPDPPPPPATPRPSMKPGKPVIRPKQN